MKRFVSSAVIAAIALAAATARADVPAGPFQFAWVRGEGAQTCPDGATIMRAVAQRIGRDPFALDGASSIEVTVTHERARWVARIYLRSADGSPIASDVLTSTVPSCSSIALAAAVAIGITIDPDAATRGPVVAPAAPSSAPSASSAPPASSASPASSAPPEIVASRIEASSSPPPSGLAPDPNRSSAPPAVPLVRPPRRSARFSPSTALAARAVGAYGVVPAFAAAVAIDARVNVHPRFAASLGAYLFPETALGPAPAQLAFTATGLSVGGCGTLVSSRVFGWDACAAFIGGAIQPVALQRPAADVGAKPWLALGTGLHVRVRIVGPLAIGAGIEAIVPFVRYRFLSRGSPTAEYEQTPIAVIGTVGPEITFR